MQSSSSQGSRVNEVKANLAVPDSGDLIDFIKVNLKPAPIAPITPATEAASIAAQTISSSNSGVTEIKAPLPSIAPPAAPIPEPVPDLKVNPLPTEVSPDVEDLLDLGDKDKSWKGLRQQVTRSKNLLEEKEKILKEKEEYIEKIKKGEEEIEPLKLLKEENQKLSRYRDMYDLETSPDYIKTYIEPVQNAKEELKKYAEEYEVPVEELENLLTSDSVSKTNRFLSDHFDAIGGVQVKSILDTIKNLKQGESVAKEQPRITLDKLKSDSLEAMREQDNIRLKNINGNATTSWTKTLTALQTTGDYPEITFRGDPTHDEFAKSVMQNGATRYGSIVTKIGNLGIKDLPEDLATELAAVCALSETAGVMAQSRSHIFNEHQKVVGDARRRSNYESPPLGGFSRGGTAGAIPAEKGPNSPMEAGDAILRKIGIPTR